MSGSLQKRLLLVLVVLLGAGWMTLWGYTQLRISKTASDDIDARLRQASTNLLIGWSEAQRHNLNNDQSPPDRGITQPTAKAATTTGKGHDLPEFELTSLNQGVIIRSAQFPHLASATASINAGFSDKRIHEVDWRLLTVVDRKQGVICRVGASSNDRDARASLLSSRINTPLLWALPILALLIWIGIWGGLRPLRHLSREIAQRDPMALEPLNLTLKHVPAEVGMLIDALNQLFARLRETLAAQRAFTSAVGHELRTPLAGIKAHLQVARKASAGPQKEHALQQLEHATGRMERVITQLLMLARMDPAAKPLRKQNLDIADLVRRTITAHTAGERNVNLTHHIEADLPRIKGDPALLETLLGNLLDNAMYYAPVNSQVQVALARNGSYLELSVRDQGPGIPAAEQRRVFDAFYRGENTYGPGNGLGLTVVRAVAEAHGGNVRVVPASLWGTEIAVHIPAGLS